MSQFTSFDRWLSLCRPSQTVEICKQHFSLNTTWSVAVGAGLLARVADSYLPDSKLLVLTLSGELPPHVQQVLFWSRSLPSRTIYELNALSETWATITISEIKNRLSYLISTAVSNTQELVDVLHLRDEGDSIRWITRVTGDDSYITDATSLVDKSAEHIVNRSAKYITIKDTILHEISIANSSAWWANIATFRPGGTCTCPPQTQMIIHPTQRQA